MSKKKKITIISCVSAGVLLIGAAVAFFLIFLNPQKPEKSTIIADLNGDKAVTSIDVGQQTYDFKVTDIAVDEDTELEENGQYTFAARVSRECEIYRASAVVYTVVYERKGGSYQYASATIPQSLVNLTFEAKTGFDPELAEKKVLKTYGGAVFDRQETDLEKGIDKIYFKVDDKEYEGTAAAVYKFDSSKGWVFKKINDSEVGFKKGVTHKENGLYTNSAVKNVLFLGIDGFSGVGRSDCMMLISVDSNTGTIKQTSFMRDNFFEIPGYGYNKLNSAYAFGGADLTVKTIQNTFGIKIDNYVAVDFSTFKEVINNLGGVNVDITSDEAGYINWQLAKNGQTGVGLVSTAGGKTHLNGQQALWLCRDRGGNGFGGNDFTRTGRQRRVIQSLITTYSNYTPSKVLSTLKILKKNVKTDLTLEDFKWYAQRSVKFFKYKARERCVPDDGEWHSDYSSGGAWIISIDDFSGLKKEIQQYIYEDLK